MNNSTNTIERIKFIPNREEGEPKGELLEGEVIYTSTSGNQKVVRTDDQSIHIISDLEGSVKEEGEWEHVSTAFNFERTKSTVEAADELMKLITAMRR